MTTKQLAEHASTIKSGFGKRHSFNDEPEELDFDDDDAAPIDPATVCECGGTKEPDEDECGPCWNTRKEELADMWADHEYESRRGN